MIIPELLPLDFVPPPPRDLRNFAELRSFLRCDCPQDYPWIYFRRRRGIYGILRNSAVSGDVIVLNILPLDFFRRRRGICGISRNSAVSGDVIVPKITHGFFFRRRRGMYGISRNSAVSGELIVPNILPFDFFPPPPRDLRDFAELRSFRRCYCPKYSTLGFFSAAAAGFAGFRGTLQFPEILLSQIFYP